MKKIDSTEETSGLIVKEQNERSHNKGPKKVPKLLAKIMIITTANNQGT